MRKGSSPCFSSLVRAEGLRTSADAKSSLPSLQRDSPCVPTIEEKLCLASCSFSHLIS